MLKFTVGVLRPLNHDHNHPLAMQAPFIRFVPGDKPPRAECIENGCTIKNVAQACGHKRCKRHCLLQAAPCGQSGHDVARRAGTLTAIPQPLDPSNLAHPPPVIPLLPVATISLTPPSTNPSNTAVSEDTAAGSQDPPSRNFRIPMPSSFQADWDARTQARNTKRQAEEERRKHLALLNQEYTVNIWVQVRCQPVPRAYGTDTIPEWPSPQRAQPPRLSYMADSHLGISDGHRRALGPHSLHGYRTLPYPVSHLETRAGPDGHQGHQSGQPSVPPGWGHGLPRP